MEQLQFLINGLSVGSVYGLVALGCVLIYKATEQVSFAQGEILMLGAFIMEDTTSNLLQKEDIQEI